MRDGNEYGLTVVRLFPDYAGSCVWFPDPVDYDDTGFSAELVAELRVWEQSYDDGLGPDFAWRSRRDRRRFARKRRRLGHWVARELGQEFRVEVDIGGRLRRTRRLRAPGPAVNTSAAAAFHALAERTRAERELLSRAIAEGQSLRWVADRPADEE